jgi:hypothetical protein
MNLRCNQWGVSRVGRRYCKDKGAKGHGILPARTREAIKRGTRAGRFGGEGVMKTLDSCKAQVNKQHAAGIPYIKVSRRIQLLINFNKRMNPRVASIATSCRAHAKRVYGK